MPDDASWYYAKSGQSVGPMTLAELRGLLPSIGGPRTLVYGPSTAEWMEARHVAALVESGPPEKPPVVSQAAHRSDEIDYEIFGKEMQYVEVTLDPGEMVIAEAGAMMYMTTGIQMETVFGDPSAAQGGLLEQGGRRRQAGADRRVAVHDDVLERRAAGREDRGLCRALPGQDPADASRPAGRRVDLPARVVHLRGAGHADRHRVSEAVRRGAVRRRRVHHAAADRRRHRAGPRRRHADAAHAGSRRDACGSTPAVSWPCSRA